MRYLTIAEVLETYQRVMQQTGGLVRIRDLGALESAVAQPYMTFGGNKLYPSLAEKAAALFNPKSSFCRRQQTHRSCHTGIISCLERL